MLLPQNYPDTYFEHNWYRLQPSFDQKLILSKQPLLLPLPSCLSGILLKELYLPSGFLLYKSPTQQIKGMAKLKQIIWRDKFESGSRSNWMYTTYATSILQLKIKSGSKYGAENHRKLMAAPRPNFQQFVDYLLRTEVLLWSLPRFPYSLIHMLLYLYSYVLQSSKNLLFACERLQRPLATFLDPLWHLFKPIWHNWKFWNHQWWCSCDTRCEWCNFYPFD